jgi:uncharacterized protein YjcR
MSSSKIIGLTVLVVLIGLYTVYRIGYNTADTKHQIRIQELANRINELEKQEAIIEKEIVTVYKDRVVKVNQVRERIIEVTRDVLHEESANCTIGPNFISLHNAAAGATSVSDATRGTDGSP